ncbi:family 43 glycosylhydrolase [Cellulomonas fimi]|uniref:family 43 glycosylhydrolase n=1 Tax=Cellulomonas fimi TaxID=1708 RepID=UPI00234E0E06|nr:family 43 glycosylhydrolase [Cellulomonas fimi]MDC7121511.1 family 43 glycosylhydrolase [Cellulomonas fimi]
MRPSASLTATAAVALVLAAGAAAPSTAESADHDGARGRASTYVNPVSAGFADTFADPAVLRGKDGWWYAYGTTDPLREGEGARHLIPTARSADLVSWEYVGDAFTEGTQPAWADARRGAALWAPDVRYVDGQYRMYYVVTETTVTEEPNDSAIGVATAPTPAGPWTPVAAPVVAPRHGTGGAGDFLWTFDPSHVVAPDGTEHLFYGSYYGGIWTVPLSADGTAAVGDPVQVAIDNKYEGAYVVQRDGWWYLFASSANCCAGPTTGYSVHVGRSRDLAGPYVDREGVPLLQSRAGGTPVVAPNGNRWVGTGHNAVVTDLAGQDWLAYHAIDRADPYLDGTDGINERPMLLDRLDWVDGWPTVRGGAWASDDEERAPVTDGRTATTFADGLPRAWSTTGTWADTSEPDAGRHVRSDGRAAVVTRSAVGKDARVEADVRLDAGATASTSLVLTARAGAVRATLDPVTRTLVVERTQRGRTVDRASAPVPSSVDLTTWHATALTVRGGVARAELTHARLGDPLATAALDVRHHAVPSARGGVVASGPGVHVDNLSALPAARPATRTVPVPQPGAPLRGLSDEFDGTSLGAGWVTLRDPQVTVADGVLTWPTEAADLVGTTNDAGVLLRDVPETDWVAETRLTTDLGTGTVRNYQQGGLIAYVDDDLWARLSHVAIWNTRQTEYGTERPYAGRLSYGGTIVGPPAETTWLRLVHRTDRTGEHDVQAFTSTDGRTWVAGGVWTFPAGSDLQVGLVSHGGAGAANQFDYLRVSRLARG